MIIDHFSLADQKQVLPDKMRHNWMEFGKVRSWSDCLFCPDKPYHMKLRI